jgi:hypothetical protein
MNAVRRQLEEVVLMWDRVNAAGYAAPARVRLLDAINDRLKPITTLETLDHEGRDGLTFWVWLFAIDLRKRVLRAACELDA